mmetsp:Transcript_59682/g.122454  ORF Transcript_59682/g.122454 Transcript_59682/m.122454 type:complete len:990 (-) Transcript_59682:163-3132(-)
MAQPDTFRSRAFSSEVSRSLAGSPPPDQTPGLLSPAPTSITPNTTDLMQDLLPPESEWKYSGVLQKRGMSACTVWQDRLFVLTEDHLCYAKKDSKCILDVVPLHEIEEIFWGSHEDRENAEQEKNEKRKSNDLPKRSDTRDSATKTGNKDGPAMAIFTVSTVDGGHNSGRPVILNAESPEVREEWISRLKACAHEAAARKKTELQEEYKRNKLRFLRWRARQVYGGPLFQALIAIIILASFATELYGSEVRPAPGSHEHHVLFLLDASWTAFFTFDLGINMFGHWFRRFFSNGWNCFDLVIVSISLASLPFENVPAMGLLRLLRIFRVVRLFRRLKYLQRIIDALLNSLLPVVSSFGVLMVITVIYAILASRLYAEASPEFFANFSTALFTMMQLCTGDSWASQIVRSLFHHEGKIDHFVAFFFLSYVIIANVILINIVIAVLLDEFVTAVQNEKLQEEKAAAEYRELHAKHRTALDPLLESLSHYDTTEELSQRIEVLYDTLDGDDSGSLDFNELNLGLRRLKYNPPIHLSTDDFNMVTEGENLCNAQGELDRTSFEAVIRKQLERYAQHQTANVMADVEEKYNRTVLFNFKNLTLMMMQLSEKVEQISATMYPETPEDSSAGRRPNHVAFSIAKHSSKNQRSSSHVVHAETMEGRQDTAEGRRIEGAIEALKLHVDDKFASVNKELKRVCKTLASREQSRPGPIARPVPNGGDRPQPQKASQAPRLTNNRPHQIVNGDVRVHKYSPSPQTKRVPSRSPERVLEPKLDPAFMNFLDEAHGDMQLSGSSVDQDLGPRDRGRLERPERVNHRGEVHSMSPRGGLTASVSPPMKTIFGMEARYTMLQEGKNRELRRMSGDARSFAAVGDGRDNSRRQREHEMMWTDPAASRQNGHQNRYRRESAEEAVGPGSRWAGDDRRENGHDPWGRHRGAGGNSARSQNRPDGWGNDMHQHSARGSWSREAAYPRSGARQQYSRQSRRDLDGEGAGLA